MVVMVESASDTARMYRQCAFESASRSASLAAGESVNGEMRSSFILEAEITVLSADGERSGQSDSVPMKSPALTCTRPR